MQSHPFELKSKTLEVIKASAGSGKTTALINNFLQSVANYREQNKIFPKVIISTFTRKATRELKERLMIQAIRLEDKELIHYISYSPHLQISTLHGIFHNFLQLQGHHIHLSPGFEIIDEQEAFYLFDTVLKEQLLKNKNGIELLKHYQFYEIQSIILDYLQHNQYSPYGCSATIDELQNILQKKIQAQKEDNKEKRKLLQDEKHLLSEFISTGSQLENLANKVLDTLTQKKKEMARITFNDLELMTLEVLQKQPIKQSIADFWFLDEYQDTSHIQDEILNHLTKNSRVFIVGDPQQSIYYFRGASSSVFLKKEKQSKPVQRNQNYRSSPELIAFFNKFFSSNPAFAKIFNPMNAQNKNSSEFKECIKFIPSTEDIKQKTVKRIKQLLSTGAETKNIAILSRKNKTLFEWAQYFKKEQWPVQLHSSGNFKHKREIKDSLFLLKFLLNRHNDENLIGLLRTPYCRIPDHTLIDWMNEKDEESLWSFCHKMENNIIQQLIYFLKQSQSEGVVYTFQNALESLGMLDLATYEDPTGLREANLWKMIYYLRDYELNGSSSLLSFINKFLDFQPSQPNQSQRSDSPSALPVTESSSLQLMTIHQSKGLEFEHVILLDDFPRSAKSGSGTTDFFTAHRESGKWALSIRTEKEDKRIKSQYHQQIIEWNNEEIGNEMNRLIYVALTRAKKSLTVVHLTKNSFLSKNFCL